ncbi:MAG: ornithine aminotransferase [Candidatus Sericytochromatia bacterium]|nr:MAG: ornithine aminotransferase [Candidatus Sericytochromatia bacterium]
MNTNYYIELEKKFGANNYHPLDVVIEKAEGVWFWDVEGNKYMDALASYSAVNQGHCHPKLIKTFVEQASKVTLTSRAFRNKQLPLLYKKLYEITKMEMFLLMNSGAEAVETAIKAARKWGYDIKGVKNNKAEIIVCANNFHGRTTTIISFSTEEEYRRGFGPFTPGFKIIEFNDIEQLEKAINENTVAFLVEPIQAEAGVYVPFHGYLKKAEEICKKNNVLFMLDEIQTGLGRTGKLFAHYYEDVNPDVIIIGKALSGGFYPVSAVLAKREVLEVFEPGTHGSTFGGNPLGCAVAQTALDVLIEENLIENSYKLGNYFKEELLKLHSSKVKEIRGKGLLIGIELFEKARPICEKLKNLGLLCKDTHGNIIRFTPPLVISKDEIDWALEKISSVLKD